MRLRVLALALGLGGCAESASPVPDAAPGKAPAAALPNAPAPAPVWTDAWLLEQTASFLDDATFRRQMLEASLTNPDNVYSAVRLSAYGREHSGWDTLPVWIPTTSAVDDATVAALRGGSPPTLAPDAAPVWDGQRPATMQGWVDLGRRVFFSYPLRPEVFAEHALAHPDVGRAVGLVPAPDGSWPGVVTFRDLDGSARIGITCALCHVSVEGDDLVIGRARRDFDYGQMRLSFHRDTGAPLPADLAARMASWGPGRADITQDDDEDPVAIPDLWRVREQSHLTQAGTLRQVHPAALAIRQETQILHANRERTRPPRELAWALAMYVYSLTPPGRPEVAVDDRTRRGHALFETHCRDCHDEPNGTGLPIDARRIGTEPSLAFGDARGTGKYRPAPLVRVAEAAPYLHHGVVASLDELLSPARFEADYAGGVRGPGPIPGHRWGTDLPADDRAAVVAFLRTL
jgi:hypothetical protein